MTHGMVSIIIVSDFMHVFIFFVIGTKNVNKELMKVSQGLKRDKNIKWFPELFDKRKGNFKMHIF